MCFIYSYPGYWTSGSRSGSIRLVKVLTNIKCWQVDNGNQFSSISCSQWYFSHFSTTSETCRRRHIIFRTPKVAPHGPPRKLVGIFYSRQNILLVVKAQKPRSWTRHFFQNIHSSYIVPGTWVWLLCAVCTTYALVHGPFQNTDFTPINMKLENWHITCSIRVWVKLLSSGITDSSYICVLQHPPPSCLGN